jgi:hypothetical protein
LKKSLIIVFFFLFASFSALSQIRFSVASDLALQRSLRDDQQYWAFGHTVQAQFHMNPTDGIYVWLSYYTRGRFNNELTATAKSPVPVPQEINFTNKARMEFKHVSVGWKKYLKGRFDQEEGWNLYGLAGFGIMLGNVQNQFTTPIDTVQYAVPVTEGEGDFKRLTLDLGLGAEVQLGADIFLYGETRVWVPTTAYPSKYVLVNKNSPLVAQANLGIRILF